MTEFRASLASLLGAVVAVGIVVGLLLLAGCSNPLCGYHGSGCGYYGRDNPRNMQNMTAEQLEYELSK